MGPVGLLDSQQVVGLAQSRLSTPPPGNFVLHSRAWANATEASRPLDREKSASVRQAPLKEVLVTLPEKTAACRQALVKLPPWTLAWKRVL
ncbi:MAG: hypothetical protein U0031_00005, partial [Thermomicrobiales bacterium]